MLLPQKQAAFAAAANAAVLVDACAVLPAAEPDTQLGQVDPDVGDNHKEDDANVAQDQDSARIVHIDANVAKRRA